MTVQDIAKHCLVYIGVVSLDPAFNTNAANRRGLVAGDLDFVANCINQAMQEILRLGPTALSEQPYAEALRPPTNITVTVSQYSKLVPGGIVGYSSWMKGCTIRLPDGLDNEVESSTSLVRPYMGANQVLAPGTVYADAIAIGTGFFNVMEPVKIPTVVQLEHASSLEEFRFWVNPHRHGNRSHASYDTTVNKTVGQPAVWFAEGRYNPAEAFITTYLRVNPMPAQAYEIDFRVKRKPPIISAADIGDHLSEPATVLPVDLHESVLLPLTLQRFTAHPSFNSEKAREEIARQVAVAKLILEGLNPPIAAVRGHYA